MGIKEDVLFVLACVIGSTTLGFGLWTIVSILNERADYAGY